MTTPRSPGIFLQAHWKNLVFANYVVDPGVMVPYLPKGTEVDLFNGQCFVSLVGFMFLDTRIKGIRFPFHVNFEEFNLRCYVRFPEGDGYKRGVVFVREIVPRRMITQVARLLYGERYYYQPMRNSLLMTEDHIEVSYEFLFNKNWNTFRVKAGKEARPLLPDSETSFITEHYWGYTRLSPTTTSEYKVEHLSWNIHPVTDYEINCDTLGLYGAGIHEFLQQPPHSVFMAQGSPVRVYDRRVHRF